MSNKNSFAHLPRLGLFTLAVVILGGCWGTHRETNKSCFQPTFIQSSNDVKFYLIEIGNKVQYSNLNNSDDEDNYLCVYDRKSHAYNECIDKAWYINKTTELETGSKVELSGVAIYTIKWGLSTMDSGPSPTTWFKGNIQGKPIWVYTTQLLSMFESNSDFKDSNLDAFNKLKFSKRIPPPIEKLPDGFPIHASVIQNMDFEEREISKWKCD